ncbi:MAG: stalk domain-containing protein [Aminipila sp.]
MRKKIAAAICLILLSMSFLGCSNAELGYLKLANEVNNLKSFEISGEAEVYYNADEIKKVIYDTMQSNIYTKQEFDEEYKDFQGKQKIKLTYKGNIDLSDDNVMYFMDLSATLNNEKIQLGKVYISLKDGVYVERDLLINLYKSSKAFLPNLKDSYFYSGEYERDLRDALGSSEYIEIVSADSLKEVMYGVYGENANILLGYEKSSEIYESASNFLTKAFKGYSTGCVSQINSGYAVEVNGEKLTKVILECFDYVANNIDLIIDSFSEYTKELYTLMEPSLESQVDLEEFNLDKNERAELAGTVLSLKGSFEYYLKDGSLDFLKMITFKESIKKINNDYVSELSLSMDKSNNSLAYLKVKNKVTPKQVEVEFPLGGTPVETVIEDVKQVENKYNPVNAIEVTWMKDNGSYADEEDWDYGYDYCNLYYERKYTTPLSQSENYDWCEYKNINKSMYVPFRQICDILGEEIGWDNKAKKAYVIKDGKNITVDTILEYKTSFVKIKDFEKLGYTVSYDGSQSGYHVVRITKK